MSPPLPASSHVRDGVRNGLEKLFPAPRTSGVRFRDRRGMACRRPAGRLPLTRADLYAGSRT